MPTGRDARAVELARPERRQGRSGGAGHSRRERRSGSPGDSRNPGHAGRSGGSRSARSSGYPGHPGTPGAQGLQGIPGIQGIPGVKGDKGDQGDAGPVPDFSPLVVNVNCTTGQKISDALKQTPGRPLTINVTGPCTENVTITRDDVTLQGVVPNTLITAAGQHRGDACFRRSSAVPGDQDHLSGGFFGLNATRGAPASSHLRHHRSERGQRDRGRRLEPRDARGSTTASSQTTTEASRRPIPGNVFVTNSTIRNNTNEGIWSSAHRCADRSGSWRHRRGEARVVHNNSTGSRSSTRRPPRSSQPTPITTASASGFGRGAVGTLESARIASCTQQHPRQHRSGILLNEAHGR
jgi:hypothetical protein